MHRANHKIVHDGLPDQPAKQRHNFRTRGSALDDDKNHGLVVAVETNAPAGPISTPQNASYDYGVDFMQG